VKNTVTLAGIHPEELAMVRTLVDLLRHRDPVVPELARQALQYVKDTSIHSQAIVSAV
jgi:hypothetical protein